MTAPAPPPAPGGPGQTITVTPENVLAARRVIGEAAEDAKFKLQNLRTKLMVQASARDEISTTAAAVWNRNLLVGPESHFERLHSYVESVEELANQLEEAAKAYGFTDEEIEASFKSSEARF
ncbi:hypothetical protein GCM10027271_27320 [Saccharopolyspora gloriosae]|uniref:Uncharacterized protein YukE n=1 Tax=Saccharopolyspora gloriosae TaxID=455344 RepID=A0A840NM77_9PSEU|nr:hypothetical protein [Saccharopolyspora gloriosae]MBB5071428.1 uncharacterized protein YukE [Saccharopolyspora gloriosae]